MTRGPTTKIEGADTVARTLGDAESHLNDLAPPEVGAFLVGKSRAAAPYVSGTLRRSINADVSPGRVRVVSGLIYSHVIHNGWAAHNIAAQPFLIPVAEAEASAWGEAYVTATARTVRADVKGA